MGPPLLASSDPRIARWTPLAAGIARQFHKKLWRWCEVADLVAIGVEALWRATLTYEDEHGSEAQFQTYARHAIVNAFLAEGHRWRALKRKDCVLSESMDEEVFEIGQRRQYASELPSPESALLLAEERSSVRAAVDRLKTSEQFVIEKRLLDELTLVETGLLRGVSRERIRQIEKRALTKLRDRLKSDYGPRAKHGQVDGLGHTRRG